MCFTAWLEVSGISKRKCQKFLKNISLGMIEPPEDGRSQRPQRDSVKADHARSFFQYLYDHLAEPLAEGEPDPEAEDDDTEIHDEFSFWIRSEASENPVAAAVAVSSKDLPQKLLCLKFINYTCHVVLNTEFRYNHV